MIRRTILSVLPAQQAAANAAVAAFTGNPADALTFTVPRYDNQGTIVAYVASWDLDAHGIALPALLAAATQAAHVPQWRAGEAVTVGARRWYDGTLVECVQAHTTQADWTPPVTPALWKQHRAELAAWVQPAGAHDAYPLGARVTYNGRRWRSTTAANVWAPGVYGWVDEGAAGT